MANLFKSLFFKWPLVQTVRKAPLSRGFHSSALNMIKVGEMIPPGILYEGNPGNEVDIQEVCKDKLIVLFGLPGAFTPGCSRTHLAGYVERYFEFKKKGVDEIICLAVNDVFVLEAWGKFQDANGKVRMFADPDATYVKTLGCDIILPKLGGVRSKRFSMVIKNQIITVLNVEPDGLGFSCSLAANLYV